MSDKTKFIIYITCMTCLLIYLSVAWYEDKRDCESGGGIYLRGFISWDCVTKNDFK